MHVCAPAVCRSCSDRGVIGSLGPQVDSQPSLQRQLGPFLSVDYEYRIIIYVRIALALPRHEARLGS